MTETLATVMTLPFADSTCADPTRRQFLSAAAAGIALGLGAETAETQLPASGLRRCALTTI